MKQILCFFFSFFTLVMVQAQQSILGDLVVRPGDANPIMAGIGLADPHIRVYNNKVFMVSTRDIEPFKGWNMPDWRVWSSVDLVNWKLETVLKPTDTYIGESLQCFAPDLATKNGKYYIYFSNHSKNTGVAVADKPEGPYLDALGKPLLASNLTDTKEYDISVPIDADGTPYIVFGVSNNATKRYHIARLNDDMVSLAETPKPLKVKGDRLPGTDKPNLHIHKGRYYLSAGSNYAVSDNIYGPYEIRIDTLDDTDPNDFNRRAHGTFFDWNNQSFYIYCRWSKRRTPGVKRDTYITYVHYKANGDMVYDRAIMNLNNNHGGVGKYLADWDRIEAEWYMKAHETEKIEKGSNGFSVRNSSMSGGLFYPNVERLSNKKSITLNVSSQQGGQIEIRDSSLDGEILGVCNVPLNTVDEEISSNLQSLAGVNSLYIKMIAEPEDMELDWFKLNNEKVVVTTLFGEIADSQMFWVFPNPSSNGLFQLNRSGSWEIISLQGESLLDGNGKSIDLKKLNKGVYLLEVEGQTLRILYE